MVHGFVQVKYTFGDAFVVRSANPNLVGKLGAWITLTLCLRKQANQNIQEA